VVHAATGADALEILLTTTPDVLMAGIEDSEINGKELCSIIKTSSRLQHIPVILLTRSAQPSDYSACHKEGAILCMAAPSTPNKRQHAARLVAPLPRWSQTYTQLRQMPRYPLEATTEILTNYSTRPITGRVTEISRKGCYVDTLHPLPLGTPSRVTILRDSDTFMTSGQILCPGTNRDGGWICRPTSKPVEGS